LKCETK